MYNEPEVQEQAVCVMTINDILNDPSPQEKLITAQQSSTFSLLWAHNLPLRVPQMSPSEKLYGLEVNPTKFSKPELHFCCTQGIKF